VLTCPIVDVVRETPRTRVVRLGTGGARFAFEAGQYVLIGDRGQEARRPYSIACAPAQAAQSGLLEFLIQVDAGGSPGPHLARLEAGRVLDVEGPAGAFVLRPEALTAGVALIGGGTGIAPLRSMLWQALIESPSVRVAMLQSARTPGDLAYAAELRALAAEGRIGLVETVTRDAEASWRGARGRIDASQLARVLAGPDTLCYVCGPDSLVEDVPRLLGGLGVAPANIRTEHWAD
jgi:ferredoxin-NADP reductase